MKRKIEIISIAILLILLILTVNVKAVEIQAMHSGLLKAFALSAGENNGNITVTNSAFIYNEETEQYDITLNLETEGLTDGTEIKIDLEGYSLENTMLRRRLIIHRKWKYSEYKYSNNIYCIK